MGCIYILTGFPKSTISSRLLSGEGLEFQKTFIEGWWMSLLKPIDKELWPCEGFCQPNSNVCSMELEGAIEKALKSLIEGKL